MRGKLIAAVGASKNSGADVIGRSAGRPEFRFVKENTRHPFDVEKIDAVTQGSGSGKRAQG